MADSENKTVPFQYKILYINTNITVMESPIDFYPFTSSCQMAKVLLKNKFELDRSDLDSHTNRAERYLV